MEQADAVGVGRLYFDAYEAGEACATLEEALADVEASFAGEYGELWPPATLLIEQGGDVVAAVMTVRRAPWDDTPPCPFIIELFTDRSHRRRGLGRGLVGAVSTAAAVAGESCVGLRVMSHNHAAVSLYASLGFEPAPDPG